MQLLLSFGADPNKTDRYGRNVVKQAAMMRRKDIVRVLEKYYPTPKVRPVQIGRASLPASYKPDANLSPRRTNRTRISPAPRTNRTRISPRPSCWRAAPAPR